MVDGEPTCARAARSAATRGRASHGSWGKHVWARPAARDVVSAWGGEARTSVRGGGEGEDWAELNKQRLDRYEAAAAGREVVAVIDYDPAGQRAWTDPA